MTLYSIGVFVHVVGALGLFAAMGLEWVMIDRVRRTRTAEQAHDWLDLLGVIRRLSPASMGAILVAGIYLAVAQWGGAAWIVAAVVALLLLPPLGMISMLRLPRIAQEMADDVGPLSLARLEALGDPMFLVSIKTRTAIALGIVFLMTNKPGAVASAIAIVVAVALGLAFSWPDLNRALRRRQAQAPAQGAERDAVEAEPQFRDERDGTGRAA